MEKEQLVNKLIHLGGIVELCNNKDTYKKAKELAHTLFDKYLEHETQAKKTEMKELHKAKHYNTYDIETIDIMEKVFGVEKLIIWCTITAFKYRMRMGKKDSINDDLFKENWYLEKAKELKNRP